MDDNNTSASNARPMTGGKQWSMHAYGVAIDINPPQNPYPSFDDDEGVAHVLSAKAAKTSVNRMDCRPNKPGRLGRAEEVVDIFANNGFLSWGGYWNFPIDYQHFEVGTRRFITQLTSAPVADADALFEQYISAYAQCMAASSGNSHDMERATCIAEVMQ